MENITLSSIDNTSVVYTSTSRSFIVGRGEQADVIISEDGISRAHSQFINYGSNYFVKDLGSTNGTFINDLPLVSGEVYLLRTGDIVRFASFPFYFNAPNISFTDPSLCAFGEEVYEGEFLIGASTSFSFGGTTATIPSSSLGTEDLIFIVKRENSELVIGQRSRKFFSYLNGSQVIGTQALKDKDRITVGPLLLLVSIPPKRMEMYAEEEKEDEGPVDLASFMKERMGAEGWDDPLKRRKSTGTLLAIEQVMSEESMKKSNSNAELGIHRFSTTNLRLEEASKKREKTEFFLGIFTIVATAFMGGILFYLYTA